MSANAAGLLRALNSQIVHDPPQIPASPLPHPESHKDSGSGLTSILLDQKPAFQAKIRYDQGCEAPECLTELLVKLHAANEGLFENVESLAQQREQDAYDSYLGADDVYVQVMLDQARRHKNEFLDIVGGMMAKRKSKVEADLSHGRLFIQKERKPANRSQIEHLHQLDLARMIQIKDGHLRSKMEVLHRKLQDFENLSGVQVGASAEEELSRRAVENINADSFSLHSERTKVARQYVHQLHLQRKSLQLKHRQREQRQKEEQSKRETEIMEAQLMKDITRKQEVLKRIEEARKKRQQQEKELWEKGEQTKEWLADHHRKMPIFKLKQKQFQERIVKPAQRYRLERLNEIKASHRAMSLQEMRQHQDKYLGKLQLSQAKREQQFKLILKSRQPKRRRYYRTSAHARIQQMTKEDVLRDLSLREASKIKANRMKEYDQAVHKLHPPAVDPQKRKQLAKSIQEVLMRGKPIRKVYQQVTDELTKEIRFEQHFQELPPRDPKAQGNKFFQEAKKYLKKKEKESPADRIEQLEQESKEEKERQKHVRMLGLPEDKKGRNLWEIRSKQLEQIANSDLVDAQKFQLVKHNIQNLDSKAARRQEVMRHIQPPIEEQIKQKSMLQQFYLQSIKEKMRLLE